MGSMCTAVWCFSSVSLHQIETRLVSHAQCNSTVTGVFCAAVRAGNLGRFGEVLEHFGAKFQADHTFTLIIRLRHNVIKTGVRMINLSYLRISLADVAHKLQLDSPEDAEFIVAKVGAAPARLYSSTRHRQESRLLSRQCQLSLIPMCYRKLLCVFLRYTHGKIEIER